RNCAHVVVVGASWLLAHGLAVTVAFALAVAAGESPKASPWTATVLTVVAVSTLVGLIVTEAPAARVLLLPLAATNREVRSPRTSSLTVTLVRSTSPVFLTVIV